jgi:predicted DNA binding CopG/RHH family protein
MKRQRLTREEKAIEDAVVRGEFKPVSNEKLAAIVSAIERRRKDAVISIRLNAQDLAGIKRKAQEFGVPYQTLISELIRHYSQ